MEDIIQKVSEVKSTLKKHGFAPLDFTVEIAKLKAGAAGIASSKNSSIKVSSAFLQEHRDHILSTTIPHEICHLYVHHYYPRAKQYHGPEFRQLMRLLGLRGDTYHKLKLSASLSTSRLKTRYVYLTAQSGTRCELTKQQHLKVSAEPLRYTKNGEYLLYTGMTVQFK
jgi:predicted SprT family Zn-dependent metalloprotease